MHAVDFSGAKVRPGDGRPYGRRMLSVTERQGTLNRKESGNDDVRGIDCSAYLGNPGAMWEVNLLRRNVWVEKMKTTRDTQLRKYLRFADEVGRGTPPGENRSCCQRFLDDA